MMNLKGHKGNIVVIIYHKALSKHLPGRADKLSKTMTTSAAETF
jgi:hypothetical protein